MKKKIISLILCSTLALSSAVTASAFKIDSKSFVELPEEYDLPENKILQYTYNIDLEHNGRVLFFSYDTGEILTRLDFKNCSNIPKTIDFKQEPIKYALGVDAEQDFTGKGGFSAFECDGGKYKKVRVKLSDFDDSFTEDGRYKFYSYTFDDNVIADFNKKYNANGGYYDTFLVIKSGAAYNAVVPDENGEVEFYLSLNPTHTTLTLIDIGKYDITMCSRDLCVQFGDVTESGFVDVTDVTYIQMALAGVVTLDDYGKFNADINLDDVIDVKDVTALQIALAKKA